MNYSFYMPTRLIQGQGCVRRSAAVFASLGTKAFIVTGKHSARKNGSLDDVTAALTEAGLSWEVFDEIMSNPTIEVVYRGADAGLRGGLCHRHRRRFPHGLRQGHRPAVQPGGEGGEPV